MIDLERQLAQYGDFHDEDQGPIAVLEILSGDSDQIVPPEPSAEVHSLRSHRAGPRLRPARVRRSLPIPWAAVVAATLVLFFLGVIPVWLSGSETTTVADVEPPVTLQEGEWPAIETTDLDMSPTSLGVLRWTRVSGDEETLPVGFIESDPDGSGYLVHDHGEGVLWRSSDGLTWEREAAAARDPSEWVAPWVSADDAGWSILESLFPDGAVIFATDFGWVATDMPQSRHVFAISDDGVSWEEVLGPPGPHIPSGGSGTAGAAGDLLFVTVGAESGERTLWIGTFHDFDFQPPAAWPAIEPTDLDRSVTSLGTLSWTRVSGDAETLPGRPIEADRNGGYRAEEADGSVWSSPDGLHWTHDSAPAEPIRGDHDDTQGVTEDEPATSSGTTESSGVFETNFGLARTSMPQSIHVIAVSEDGEVWEEVLGPPGPHEPSGAGVSHAGAAGDLIWVLVVEESGARTLWVGTFEE